MSLNFKYNFLFFILLFILSDYYNKTLTYIFLVKTDFRTWELHFSSIHNIILFETVINSFGAWQMFFLTILWKLFLIPFQNFFYFELKWLRLHFLYFLARIYLLIFFSYYIYFYFIIPIEYSWVLLTNDIFG